MTSELEINLLKKINRTKPTVNAARAIYMEEELKLLKSLISEGKVIICWDDYIPQLAYQYLDLTKQGKVTLFINENSNEVINFISLLKKHSYDSSLLNDFLLTMDLSKPANEILTIDNFLWYCNMFDRCENNTNITLTLK